MKRTINYILLTGLLGLMSLVLSHCGRQEGRSERKIKLDQLTMPQGEASARLETTLQVQPEERRSIAVFYFDNVSGDEELDWMRRGLTEMLITDLSQFRFLNVVGEHDLETLMLKMGITGDRKLDVALAIAVAKEAKIENVLTGSFVRVGDDIRIDALLHNARTGNLLKTDRVECRGLEGVFPMVDDLTKRVRDGLRLTLKDVMEFDKNLADATTTSVEAYRYFTEGLRLNDMFYYEEAVESFERAIAIDSTFATAYARLATTFAAMGRREDMLRALARAVALADRVTERERLTIMALDATVEGDMRRIIETYEQMVFRFPEDKEARLQLGTLYYRLERFEEAIIQLEKALTIDNTYKHVYNILGYTYASRGMYQKALESHRRYIELAPDEPNPHDSMGEIYQQAGFLDEAIKAYKKALRLKSDLHYSWEHMANVLTEKGDFNQALRLYQRYIEVCPSDYLRSYGYQLMAEAHWAKGDYDAAVQAYRDALKLYPNSFHIVSRIGPVLEAKGDTLEANKFREEWFWNEGERVLMEGSFSEVNTFVSVCLYNDLHPAELEPHIERAMELAENDFNRAQCLMQRGIVSFELGESDSALARFQRAARTFLTVETAQGMEWLDIQHISLAIANASGPRETGQVFVEKMIAIARDMDNMALETSVRYMLLEHLEQSGNEEGLKEMLGATGTPRESDWWIIGPFENKNGLQRRFPPEREIELAKSYKGKAGKVQWRRAEDSLFDGHVNLKEILYPNIWVVAYGLLSVDCPESRSAVIRVGVNEGMKLWLNGEEVWINNQRRAAVVDDDSIPVQLRQGTNTVLIKVCQKIGEWGFFFRITDSEGRPFDDLTYLPQVIS